VHVGDACVLHRGRDAPSERFPIVHDEERGYRAASIVVVDEARYAARRVVIVRKYTRERVMTEVLDVTRTSAALRLGGRLTSTPQLVLYARKMTAQPRYLGRVVSVITRRCCAGCHSA